jgi:ribosomal protein S18 acetylase RimI-like enzyme
MMGEGVDSIRIENLAQGQLDALVDAQNRIFQDYIIQIKSSRQFFLDFQRSVGGSSADVLLAMDGDEIVGYVNPVIDLQEGWIGGIGVLRNYRGRGIGTKLMLAAENELRRRGANVVFLEVIEGNFKAQRLYERLGYVKRRMYLTAEGRPVRFEGFGQVPKAATLPEILGLHERAYKDTCWQRRKTEALVESARGSEMYKLDGGFVLVRSVETTGFIPFLGVVPEERRQGIGTTLAKFALTRLYDTGAFKVAFYNINADVPTQRLLDMFSFMVTMKQIEMKKTL